MWLVEEFKVAGLEFDHLYAFEKNIAENKYRQTVPDEYQDRITYFQGAISGAYGPIESNPLLRFRQICRPKDYCILKVDFDYDFGENEILHEIVKDGHNKNESNFDYRLLIDEMFFEPGGIGLVPSYEMLLALREYGIRA